MPPKRPSPTRMKTRKLVDRVRTISKSKQSSAKEHIVPSISLLGFPENSLYKLSNEIIAMIFKQIGKPPRSKIYVIDNFQQVHPCYAICSTSKFLGQWYTKIMGEPSEKIQITLNPSDYMQDGKDVEQSIKECLRLLGHEGMKRITFCCLTGTKLGGDSGKAVIDNWLASSRPSRRLEPEDKVFARQHVERDLVRKTVLINNLMICIHNLFTGLETLEIQPGELPFNVWHDAVFEYVKKGPKALVNIEIVHQEYRSRKLFGYHEQLTNPKFFRNKSERPAKYPDNAMANSDGLRQLERIVVSHLRAKRTIETHSLDKSLKIVGE